MTRRKIHVSRLLLLCSLAGMSLIVMAAGSGCIPMTGTGTDCDQLVDDYIAKLQEAMVMMQSVQSEADLDDIREVFCEAVDIADQILAQGCSQIDAATLAQAQQMLDQLGGQCD